MIAPTFKSAVSSGRDLFMVTFDALRFDVAERAWERGLIPNLAALLPHGFEQRHSPATFTYAAHQAFFAGFLPTPTAPGDHARPYAMRFQGSRSIAADTLVMDAECVVSGLKQSGYHCLCIGGTSFFNPAAPLGRALAGRFDEIHWSREMGVTSARASREQFRLATARLLEMPRSKPAFVFINAAATHAPTRMFAKAEEVEGPATQLAALAELDRHVPSFVQALRARGGAFGILCSDHGTCFGEDGYSGHRVAHEKVWSVPYAEVSVEGA